MKIEEFPEMSAYEWVKNYRRKRKKKA